MIFSPGRGVSVPLSASIRAYAGHGVTYRLDSLTPPPTAPDAAFKAMLLMAIGTIYGALKPYLLVFALLFTLLRVIHGLRRKRKGIDDLTLTRVTIVVAVATLFALLSIVDAVAFPTWYAEYLANLEPIVLFAIGISLVTDVPVLLRRFAMKRGRRVSALVRA